MTTPARRRGPRTPPFRPLYPNYAEFYSEELRWCYQRSVDGDVAWCPDWRKHNEAVARVTALWMAWESARVQSRRDPVMNGNAMAAWWANYADPIMRELFSTTGTFRGCTKEGHRDPAKGGNGPLPS